MTSDSLEPGADWPSHLTLKGQTLSIPQVLLQLIRNSMIIISVGARIHGKNRRFGGHSGIRGDQGRCDDDAEGPAPFHVYGTTGSTSDLPILVGMGRDGAIGERS